MNLTQLSRCPHCGGEAKYVKGNDKDRAGKEMHKIVCIRCECGTPYVDNFATAVCKWEARAYNNQV